MGDVYRKVGRGGAGNFYTQKDIEAATSPAGDLEAQKPASIDPPPSDPAEVTDSDQAAAAALQATASSSAGPGYARTGRGGAGNFVDAETASAAVKSSRGAAPQPAIVHSVGDPTGGGSRQSARSGLSGRGGAGNWTGDEEQKAYVAEQQRKAKEALDAKVFDDVSAGLQAPGKVYLHSGGKGPHGAPNV